MKSVFALTTLLLALSGWMSSVTAQTIAQAQSSIKADLDTSLKQFAELQEKIKNERVPLSTQLNEVERDSRAMQRELDRELRARDVSNKSLLDLTKDIETLETNIQYMENLMNDFTRRFEAAINIAEKQRFENSIQSVLKYQEMASSDVDLNEVFKAQFSLVMAAMERVNEVVGGSQFTGEAKVEGGDIKKGTFTVVGPVAYFSTEDGSHSGLIDRTKPVRPNVIDIGPASTELIATVSQGGVGKLPVDPTQNDALELAKNEVTFTQEWLSGGIWMWPIGFFGVASILVAVYKAIEVSLIRLPKEHILQDLLALVNGGKKDEALAKAKQVSAPFGAMLVDAVTFSGDSRELLEEVLYERMLDTQPKLDRMLPFLAVSAATAPLLGLLGTVTGMMATFQQIVLFGTSDASKLAGGISEALVTTKWGLIVAIPALVAHAMLSRRTQGVMATMEKYAAAFVNGLSTTILK